MALIVEGMTLVFLNSAIESQYDGGLQAFIKDWDNSSLCTDGFISKISYFEECDATAALISICKLGLNFAMDYAEDIAVFLHSGFLATPCVWLETNVNEMGHLECRHSLDKNMDVHIPDYFFIADNLANYLGKAGDELSEFIYRVDEHGESGLFFKLKVTSIYLGPVNSCGISNY